MLQISGVQENVTEERKGSLYLPGYDKLITVSGNALTADDQANNSRQLDQQPEKQHGSHRQTDPCGDLPEVDIRCAGGEGAGRGFVCGHDHRKRSEEHTSELQSLMRISYAVFCLKKKKKKTYK